MVQGDDPDGLTFDALPHLKTNMAFGGLGEEVLGELHRCLKPVSLVAGTTLIEEGDPPGDAYIVVAGRLTASILNSDGGRVTVGELGEGDLVGEMSLLTGSNRTATVTAVRDCTLLRLSEDDFSRTVVSQPAALFDVARTVAGRLDSLIHGRRPGSVIGVAAVVPCGEDSRHASFAADLAVVLGLEARAAVVDQKRLAAELGSDPTDDIITSYLHRIELENDLTLLLADEADTDWSRRCVRQADVTLLVGQGTAMAVTGPRNIMAEEDGATRARHLVLVHHGEVPTDTAAVLDQWSADRYHHVRSGSRADLERLARMLTGRSVGLVLGGGGARGFAHLGVLKAMIEANIPIDHIGGTSFGSSVAAAYSSGWEWDRIVEFGRWAMADRGSLIDFSFPMVALANGDRLTSRIREAFDAISIEDLWTDFFCVSTDLTRSDVYVHRTGLVWKAVRASVAIPGILPPVRSSEGHVLVDGGVLNNLPTDVMRDVFDPKHIIAVDLRADANIPVSDLGDDGVVSGWTALARRVLPWKEPMEVPRMIDILARSSAVSGSDNAAYADLVLRPPVGDFGVLEFASHARIIEVGYQHAIDALEGWDGTPSP
jgi:NTE family protein